MTKTFPPDEFDVDDPGTGRRGAHRAKPNPLVAVVPLVLVTVAVVAIIVGAMTMLGGTGALSTDAPGAEQEASATQEPDPETTGGPSPTGSPSDSATASESPAPSDDATASESAAPEATVDMSLPVSVLNGTRTTGLAGSAADELTAAGYAIVSVDNFRQGTPPPTTVYYSTSEASATAEAIAEELGVERTELDATRGEGVVVILGEDYTP